MLNNQNDMSLLIPEGCTFLEPGLLAGIGVLLHGLNFQKLILEVPSQDKVHDLRFCSGQGEAEPDLYVPDQVAQCRGESAHLVLVLVSVEPLWPSSPAALSSAVILCFLREETRSL